MAAEALLEEGVSLLRDVWLAEIADPVAVSEPSRDDSLLDAVPSAEALLVVEAGPAVDSPDALLVDKALLVVEARFEDVLPDALLVEDASLFVDSRSNDVSTDALSVEVALSVEDALPSDDVSLAFESEDGVEPGGAVEEDEAPLLEDAAPFAEVVSGTSGTIVQAWVTVRVTVFSMTELVALPVTASTE